MKNSTIAFITTIFVCVLVVDIVHDQQTLSGDQEQRIAELNQTGRGNVIFSPNRLPIIPKKVWRIALPGRRKLVLRNSVAIQNRRPINRALFISGAPDAR